MYTGRTIEDLIATVERAEQRAGIRSLPGVVLPPKMQTPPAVMPWNCEWQREQAVIGVA